MSFDWPDYISVASTLTGFGQNNTYTFKEALYRAAISRAYYAAFKKADEFLEARPRYWNRYFPGNSDFSPTSHSDLIHDFGRKNKKVPMDFWPIYENLNKLKKLRHQADYQIPFLISYNNQLVPVKNWYQTTNDAIVNANFVLTTLDFLIKKYP